MRAMLLAPVLALALAGCRAPAPDTQGWEQVNGVAPGQAGYWQTAADYYAGKAREAVHNAKAERVRATQARLYWVVGLAMLAALACVVVAVFLPAVRKWAVYACLTAIGIAGLAWFLAWLVPYLVWVGLGLAVLLALAAVIYWKRDNKALGQVVQVVEEKVKPRLKDYRDDFREFIDTDVDKWLDARRRQMGYEVGDG